MGAILGGEKLFPLFLRVRAAVEVDVLVRGRRGGAPWREGVGAPAVGVEAVVRVAPGGQAHLHL